MPALKVGLAGCCCNASCSTTIMVTFVGLGGGTLCGCPLDISYAITGKNVSLTGTASSPCPTLNLSFSSAQLPEGAYTLHVYEQGTTCGQAYGPTGRFDGTANFTVKCPTTKVVMTLQAQFDLLTAASSFTVKYCYLGSGKPWQLAVTATGTGICQTTQYVDGNVGVTLKVTSYPATVTFNPGGTHILGYAETKTWTACNAVTSNWNSQPLVWFDQYSITATGCPACTLGGGGGVSSLQDIAGATVTLSGGLTGTGTTSGLIGNNNYGYATLTAYVADIGTHQSSDFTVYWTVQVDGFADASYNSVDWQAALGNPYSYPGSFCPAGGAAGAILPGKFCLGCPEPVSSITLSVLGQSVQLSIAPGDTSPGGAFTVNMLSLPCPPQVGQYLPPTMGPVQFYAYYVCQDINRPYLALYYASADGAPTQCVRTQTPSQSQDGWDVCAPEGGYATTFSANCNPLMATEDYVWQVGVPKYDGSGQDEYTEYPLHITISE